MRVSGVAVVALVLAVTTGGVASSAGSRPASPSVSDCVKAWNSAPAFDPHAARRANVAAVASSSFSVTWTKSSKAALTGPGCIVVVVSSRNHSLIVEGRWSTSSPVTWHTPVAVSGTKVTNAVISSNGQIALR